MPKFVLLAATVLTLCLPSFAQRSTVGTITGTIFDDAGNPVEGATAYALNVDGTSGMLPQAVTDKAGHFVIRRLQFGGYTVVPGKPEAGYPPLHEAFYAGFDSSQPEVFISADKPSAVASLKLGKQAGWLGGEVRDDANGNLIETCSELTRKSNPRLSFGGAGAVSGTFRLLIPSDTPVTLKVWAWGYDPWIYRGADARDSFSIGPGRELHIEVRLKRNGPRRQPTDTELRNMKESMDKTGCSTPTPPDN
jgi:hypothetical protein